MLYSLMQYLVAKSLDINKVIDDLNNCKQVDCNLYKKNELHNHLNIKKTTIGLHLDSKGKANGYMIITPTYIQRGSSFFAMPKQYHKNDLAGNICKCLSSEPIQLKDLKDFFTISTAHKDNQLIISLKPIDESGEIIVYYDGQLQRIYLNIKGETYRISDIKLT